MGLPVLISGVDYYKITGRYAYNGVLVITREVIYFFPDRDLIQENINREMGAWVRSPPPESRTINLPELIKKGLGSGNDAGMKLQTLIDAHIAELKQKQSAGNFSSSLPIPSRFARNEITGISISFMGELSFEAQSDRQDFGVGLFKKKILKEALGEGGFIK